MPEHFQEIPGVRGREEYDEAAELRLAAEKVKQLAVQHESDWAHAKNTAEFLATIAEYLSRIEEIGYFVDVEFDGRPFEGAAKMVEIPGNMKVFFEKEGQRTDVSDHFRDRAEGLLEAEREKLPKAA
ncbi:MAG: hypothetical protein KGJ13_01000 [Patescibacteria group bacterium]|nr:hypothetical protein [Patescibacteria group bacterium]